MIDENRNQRNPQQTYNSYQKVFYNANANTDGNTKN